MVNAAIFANSGYVSLKISSTKPLFRQLYEQLRDAILAGSLSAGTRLPSSRSLADELGVSRTTVMNAFEELAAEGYVEGRVGAGTYVSEMYTAEMMHFGMRDSRDVLIDLYLNTKKTS
ncbi:MAG: winged helix-turn-helix transcriptional regulator [Anaerolineaceae bacterium]|nr:winged helix-turn-helix transcriptional regulator [Anaerolineaceae bacterium]